MTGQADLAQTAPQSPQTQGKVREVQSGNKTQVGAELNLKVLTGVWTSLIPSYTQEGGCKHT